MGATRAERVEAPGGQADEDRGWTDRGGGQHAAHPAEARVRPHRLHHPRQGGVPEPGRLRQGPRRPLHHPRRRGSGRARAGRPHRRRHRRQHRHRPRPRRQRARLPHPHRHPGDPEPGEEGHAAPVRRDPRGGPRRPLPGPPELRTHVGAPREGARRDGAERRPVGEPVGQHREPGCPRARHRPRDLGADGRKGGRVRVRDRDRRVARRDQHGPQGAPARHRDRRRRPHGGGHVQLLQDRGDPRRGELHHRGHRPEPDHREPRRRAHRRGVPDPGRGGGAGGLRAPQGGRACASAARPGSTSRARSGSRATSAPDTPS